MIDENTHAETIAPEEIPQPEQERYTKEHRIVVRNRRDERSLAFHYVYAVDRCEYEIGIETIVDSFKEAYEIVIPDDSFAIRLAQGAIEDRDELDAMIVPFLQNWTLNRLGCCTRIILRMAVWELLYTQEPHSVVINEAVELAKSFAEKDAFKFVNGILDQLYKKQIASSRGSISDTDSTTRG